MSATTAAPAIAYLRVGALKSRGGALSQPAADAAAVDAP